MRDNNPRPRDTSYFYKTITIITLYSKIIQSIAMEMASPVNPERRNLQSQNDRIFSTNRKSVRILVSAVKIVFVILVLLALVASKVSILSILGELHHVYNSSSTDKNIQAVKFYWQLLLILCIPNVITWTRALVNGLLCNSSDNRPWPSPRYIILVRCCQCIFIFACMHSCAGNSRGCIGSGN